MPRRSKIEWCDATAQVASGCDPISEGCKFCYSARLAGTRLKNLPRTEGLTRRTADGRFVFNGTVRFHDDQVEKMLTWRAPNNLGRRPRVFVADRSDLFHDKITDAQRDKVFAAMALRPDVDWLLLTKRSARMREYLNDPRRPHQIARAVLDLFVDGKLPKSYSIGDDWPVESLGEHIDFPSDVTLKMWPLPNVHVGVSTEDQSRADERRDDLAELAKQGWTTFASYEPALGPIDWSGWGFLNQLISGGESGRGARPSHPDWHRASRDFCADRGIAYFFKQWGEWHPADQRKNAEQIAKCGDMGHALRDGRAVVFDDQWMWRVGKSTAGRLLDGVEHNGMPEVRRG